MKRIATSFVLILILSIFAGCGAANKTGDESIFNATVLEIDGNSVTVEPVDGEDILRSADKIMFSNESLDEIGVSVGDIVTITYTGAVMETYPAQINAVSWSLFEKAAPQSMPQPSNGSAGAEPSVENKVVSDYPKQAAEYLKMSLNGSALLYFNWGMEHGELILPEVNYSKARMAPDGNHILCKNNAGGVAEARWCGYSVVSLITNPAETYAYSSEQWGFQDHIWLDDNLIGFASGNVVGGQGDTWKSIQLFDNQYNPLGVTLQPSMKDAVIVGIGYDKASQRYILSCAENKSSGNESFSSNRLILSVFDEKGTLIDEIVMPEEYQSLYSPNLLALTPNNPVVTAEGHILIPAQKNTDIAKRNYNRQVLLVVSPGNQSIQELPCGNSLRLSADGKTAFAISYDHDSNNNQPAILYFEGRNDAAVRGLPDHFVADGYSGQFVPFDAVIRDRHVYIMAQSNTDDGKDFCGLFYWDMIEDKNVEQVELLQVFPGSDYCNLAGVSGEGFCYVLINGVVPESAEGDVQEHMKEKREWILDFLSSMGINSRNA